MQQAALDVHAEADRVLIEELLRLFGEEYAALKDARGLLDFNDLELRARDLLRARPDVAGEYRERFVEVMVDEFQDTNRLQVELVELVRGDELFLVGDEFQSIYRFRRAEVEIFRRLRAEAGDEVVVLPENYRSRPHVIDLVNEVYGREFGIGYQELVSSGGFAEGPPGPGVVELLLADRDAFEGGAAGWREGEADALAGRIAELVESGGIRPGQIVLLLEAGTDAGLYEDALRRRGLPTVRATGRGYYGQQEVGDLLTYLRLLRTRTDDAALLGVLASPLVGVSNDGLALIRLATRRRAAIGVFEGGELPEAMSAEDQRLARAFWMRYTRLAAAMAGLTLEQLLERIVTDHDYDLALLAQPDGDRRQANVRKLIRLAREFEGVRGPDLEGFVQFCEEQADLAAREGEAAIADEGGEAVLLMTVHSAKGLEFDVVVVADTGRVAGGTRTPDVLVAADGRVAFKAVHPLDGRLSPALGHAELGEAEDAAAAEEGRRLQYVAMTRARHHLIISGALGGNGGAAEAPIARLCHTLGRRPGGRGPSGRRPHLARRAGRAAARRRAAAAGRGAASAVPGSVGAAGRPARAGGSARSSGQRRPPPVLQRAAAARPVRVPVLRPAAARAAGAGRAPRRGGGHGRRRDRRRGAPAAGARGRAVAAALSGRDRRGRGRGGAHAGELARLGARRPGGCAERRRAA